jgi:hypothetical protein
MRTESPSYSNYSIFIIIVLITVAFLLIIVGTLCSLSDSIRSEECQLSNKVNALYKVLLGVNFYT